MKKWTRSMIISQKNWNQLEKLPSLQVEDYQPESGS